MVQAKDGGHVNPVPAFGLFTLRAQFFGFSPIGALPDIPGVNLNDQSEGNRRGSFRGGAGHLLNLLPGVELSEELGAPRLGLEALTVGFLMQPATGEIQPQALGY